MSPIAVTDLPDPDSPTTARVSPLSMCQDTPSTAFTVRSSSGKWMRRSSTSIRRLVSIFSPLPLRARRSEEHTSELQSLMRISYAVFCLKKKKQYTHSYKNHINRYQKHSNFKKNNNQRRRI